MRTKRSRFRGRRHAVAVSGDEPLFHDGPAYENFIDASDPEPALLAEDVAWAREYAGIG